MTNSGMAPVTVKAMAPDFGLTLKVQVCAVPSWHWRCRLGIFFLRLASALIGVALDVRLVARRQHVRGCSVEPGLPRSHSTDGPDGRRYGYLSVKLDGVPQEHATAYDIDAGTITRARCDAAGEIMLVGDHILSETVEGRVEVSRLQAA